MASFFNKNSTKPCEDCLITFIQAGLEYPDGTYANADTGLWLHHVVQMDTATDDAVCGKAVTNGTLSPNRFFASGNERSPVQLCADGYVDPITISTHYQLTQRNSTERTGYFLAKNSTLITSVEFMNETPRPLTGILTIDYEFIPANPFPASFQKLSSVWLDVGGCENSDVPVPSNTTFTLDTPANWVFGQSDRSHRFRSGPSP